MMSVIGLIAIGFVAGIVMALGASAILMRFRARAMEAELEVEKLAARPHPPAAPKPVDLYGTSWPPYPSPAAMPARRDYYVPNYGYGAPIDARHL